MKKEFIDNLMVQMKTLQTKLDDEIEREKIKEEELKVNDWRTKNYISMHSFCPLIIITFCFFSSNQQVYIPLCIHLPSSAYADDSEDLASSKII